jgi:DNA-binding transcriptional ArsR family regulator
MGTTKTEHYTEAQLEMATMLKAMGHPARIAIVEHLLKVDACICGDIVDELPLAQASVSQHLKELKQAGIIKGTIEGNSICYCLSVDAISRISAYFQSVSTSINQKRSNCC